MDPSKGLFRRRPSSASTHSRLRAQSSNTNASSSPSMLSVQSAVGSGAGGAGIVTAQSCPTSPKHSPLPRRSVGNDRIPEDEVASTQQPSTAVNPTTSSEAAEYAAAIEDARREQRLQQQQQQIQRSASRQSLKAAGRGNSMGSTSTGTSTARGNSAGTRRDQPASEPNGSAQLQRSASTVSGFGVRPRSSPAGLHAYTGSVPSSAHGSRVDLREVDKGSAIYLGCSAPRNSTLSIASSRGSSGGSAPPSPCNTPPSSPRHGIRRSTSLAKKSR